MEWVYLTARTGLSLGATYYYFPSKEAIVAAYYNHVQGQHRVRAFAAFAQQTTLKERLRAAYHTKLDVMLEDQGLLRALVGQHCMPTVGEFAFGPDAKYIRIDQAAEDIGRNLPIDLGIVSCELAALDALADAVPRLTHDSWIAEIAAARRKFEDQNAEYYRIGLGYADAVHPAVIARELGDFLYRGKLPKEQTTVASGGYGIARFVRRRALRLVD